MKLTTALEWLAIVVASLALSIGLIALLSGYFAGRDQAGVSISGAPVGARLPDQGDSVLRPGEPRPAYASDPPTSGPHRLATVNRDQAELSDDQLLSALANGNVVVMYGSRTPPQGLQRLQRRLSGRFSPALAAAGDSVILARRPGTAGLIGLAWAHMVRVRAPNDPLLGEFGQYWLGRGAPGRGNG